MVQHLAGGGPHKAPKEPRIPGGGNRIQPLLPRYLGRISVGVVVSDPGLGPRARAPDPRAQGPGPWVWGPAPGTGAPAQNRIQPLWPRYLGQGGCIRLPLPGSGAPERPGARGLGPGAQGRGQGPEPRTPGPGALGLGPGAGDRGPDPKSDTATSAEISRSEWLYPIPPPGIRGAGTAHRGARSCG